MDELDEAIKRTLAAEDVEAIDRLAAEQTLHGEILEMFRGRHRWMTVLGWVAGFALFGAGSYCAFRFARSDEVRAMLIWAASSGLAFLGLALVKIWFWLELQRNAVVREVKRLELQVAALAARLSV